MAADPQEQRSRVFTALRELLGRMAERQPLLLLIDDPWRISLTTDHPNGATFWRYPEIVQLLMNADFRKEQLARFPEFEVADPEGVRWSTGQVRGPRSLPLKLG